MTTETATSTTIDIATCTAEQLKAILSRITDVETLKGLETAAKAAKKEQREAQAKVRRDPGLKMVVQFNRTIAQKNKFIFNLLGKVDVANAEVARLQGLIARCANGEGEDVLTELEEARAAAKANRAPKAVKVAAPKVIKAKKAKAVPAGQPVAA